MKRDILMKKKQLPKKEDNFYIDWPQTNKA